jgi:sialate O-acetylesterase
LTTEGYLPIFIFSPGLVFGESVMRIVRVIAAYAVCCILVFLVASCVTKDQGSRVLPGLKVSCLGDSITYGFKLVDPVRQSYPARLTALSHGSWHVLNCGHNGVTVLNQGNLPVTKQDEYRKAVAFRPDVIVVMLGTNDTKNINWQHIKDFESDYISLIKKLQDLPFAPRVLVCSIPPVFNDYPNGITAGHEEKINGFIQKIIAATGVEFVDVYSALAGKPAMFIDGVHPNARGAEIIASQVYNTITRR